ncbi:MAG: hypothetical protein AUJ28_03815 [Parcubacteria group bacterium CG1_02_37_51]|uniref:ABC transporter permease n=2 Tax=Candidatus Komeiliibacteriota TaxID=1817908 RepID=A0A2M8DQV5_9BACT|nr:MAG: hypothetical protein AUJ28_03815 [Parcubacteria group bacterium CG1_02_37_51]PIY93788.1 MAG: hypothetical protein COY67_03575 [Candidatus Komeilibacteria bacterium CG_4_10_14_0_8_um_filter_37_78]PJC01673.1 MAG: hypothetical protein CO073_03090 [Candidatus Komeilibacteria bacterium CG_4_9_14_0_8_um_filter_36_9]
MQYYLFLFVAGSVLGYCLEFVHNFFNKNSKRKNPGLLYGPYLPIYGFGFLLFYSIFATSWPLLIKFLLFTCAATGIELLAGLIYIELFKVMLWDYSHKRFNFRGLICLQFSIYWLILSIVFYNFVYPYVDFSFANGFMWQLIIFIVMVVMIIDFIIANIKKIK